MPELGQKIRQGLAWNFLVRILGRFSGFLSTIIVVRFLTPDDFGLFALASIVVLLTERLGNMGSGLAIIQHENPGREELNTVWTLQLLVGFVLAVLVFATAKPIASFYSEPRVELLLYVLAIRVALMGAPNIGVVLFRKELNYARDSQYALYSKLVNSSCLVLFAIWLQNYWALVIATLVSRVLVVLLSYFMHPYRPWFSLKRMSNIGAYSIWVQVSSLGGFFNQRLDQIVLGRIGTTSALGYYRVGADLAQLLINETTSALQHILLPAYASVQKTQSDVRYLFINSFGLLSLYLFAITVGFAFVSQDFIEIIYGEKWSPAAEIATWIVYAMAGLAIINSVRAVAMSTGHARTFAGLQWSRLIFLSIALFWVTQESNSPVAIAEGRLAAMLLSLPIFIGMVMKVLGLKFSQIASSVWRPLTASLAMYGALAFLHPRLLASPQVLRLTTEVGTGAVVYCATVAILWLVFSKDRGAEKILVTQVRKGLGLTSSNSKERHGSD